MEDYSIEIKRKYPGSIVERFLSHCISAPHNPCLLSATSSHTYGEVQKQSSAIQQLLTERGTKAASHVVVIGAREPALTILLLAILKAGASFTIIDPKYPQIRIQQQIDYLCPQTIVNLQTEAPTFTCSKKTTLAPIQITRAEVDLLLGKSLNDFEINIPPVFPHADDILYINFTSGTTGIPKAIWGSHCPVTHFLEWQSKTFNVAPNDRVSVLSGLSHDPILRDLFLPLWAGASSHFPPTDIYESPGRLLSWIKNSAISIIHITPSLARIAVIAPELESNTPSRLRLAFFGGEPLEHQVATRFLSTFGGCSILNCYGATETPQVMAFQRLTLDDFANPSFRVPIGKGIDGVQILLLGDDNQLAQTNKRGEICIRTPYRAHRVEDIEHQESKQFQVNPFNANDTNDLIYRSGDIGEMDESGNIYIYGRTDRQVKIRGYRVDIAEIEKHLAAITEITAFEVLYKKLNGNHILAVAYSVTNENSTTPDSIRERLSNTLPSFMVPGLILQVDTIPLTPNGKLDRNALEEIVFGSQSIQQSPGQQQSTRVRELISILQRIAHTSQIEVSTPLTSLGLDSIRVVELFCELRKFGREDLSIAEFLSCKTVGDLLQPRTACRTPSKQASVISNSPQDDRPLIVHQSPSNIRRNTVLFSRNESLFRGAANRILQLLARIAPDRIRIWLHRMRGVSISNDVSIGYDTIIETAYPQLVKIGKFVNIGMRVTIIAHFRGMKQLNDGPSVILGDDSFIGPGAIILPNVTIGTGAVVASGSIVTSSVESMTMVQGNPARPVAKVGVPLSRNCTYDQFISALHPIED